MARPSALSSPSCATISCTTLPRAAPSVEDKIAAASSTALATHNNCLRRTPQVPKVGTTRRFRARSDETPRYYLPAPDRKNFSAPEPQKLGSWHPLTLHEELKVLVRAGRFSRALTVYFPRANAATPISSRHISWNVPEIASDRGQPSL
jgi:hypothetical protein